MKKRFSENGFVHLIIFLLPLVLFYWMLPFVSSQSLGSDYINYHVYHQLDLLFSVKSGSFPLYAPACYYGQSSVYPHAQLYHPMGYLATFMPGFWQGYSLEWITLFRLIILAFCHFCLFRFLKQMRLGPTTAFIFSLITVYNLRMLAIFWNATALEAYTGTLLLCSAIGCYYLKQTGWRPPLLIVGTTYWLITSDFPPMVFYGVIGTVIFALTLPFLYNSISRGAKKSGLKEIVRFWGKTGLFCGTGMLLSSAYLLPFFWDYMRNSSGRVDQTYQWAVQWTDTLPGFLNNFFFPLGSGFSMFGGSPLFLIAVIAPVVLVFFRIKVPPVIWALLGVIVIVCFYMQGPLTTVHRWAWEHIPLISALRGPGRIALMLPLLFMMVLTWLAATVSEPGGGTPFNPVAVTAIVAFILVVVYLCLPGHFFENVNYGCPYHIRSIPGWVRPFSLTISLVILCLVSVCFFPAGHRRGAGLLLAVFTVVQLLVFFRFGPYAIVPKEKTLTYDQILAQKKAAINFQPVFFLNQHAGSRIIVRQLNNYFMAPDLAKIYRRFSVASDIDEAYRMLNDDRQADEVIIEGFSALPVSPLKYENCESVQDQVNLTYSAYNRMVFSATACRPSFFVFSYPRSGHWQARVDGRKTVTWPANGVAHAVWLTPGKHTVEFRYWSSAAFYGMVISCLTLGMVIILVGIRRVSGFYGAGIAIAGIIVGAGLFWLWYASLYTGDNLGTRYSWRSRPASAPINLAFGKATQMSSHKPGYPYLYNSRHAVDGGRGMDSCFFTDRQETPWWQVDLGRSFLVERIFLCTGFFDDQLNCPPLVVSISEDGNQWRETRIRTLSRKDCQALVFEPVESLRYINIKASGMCVLSLNEVEAYGPDDRTR